jgi:hypothetical protein
MLVVSELEMPLPALKKITKGKNVVHLLALNVCISRHGAS